MINLFKKLTLNTKFIFEIPKKKRILIYDILSENFVKKIIKDDFSILPTRFEKISLPILVYSLILNFKDSLRFKKIYFNYLKTYIAFTNPLFVITSIDNDIRFYKFKKYLNTIKFVAIQNGYRFYKNDLFEAIEKSDYNFECDEYYCFGDHVKNYLQDKIKAKFYSIGSIKNNYCVKKKNNKKSNICFISSFGVSANTIEEKILNELHKFCVEKKIQLEILGRTDSMEEENFYYKILSNKKFIFHKKNNNFCSSYHIVDSAIISVVLNNTLGYENLGRNNKTYFITGDNRNLNCSSFLKFGYPEKFNEEGFFWTSNFEKKKVMMSINNIYNMSEQEWKDKTFEITKKLMIYDSNNKFVKNTLEQY